MKTRNFPQNANFSKQQKQKSKHTARNLTTLASILLLMNITTGCQLLSAITGGVVNATSTNSNQATNTNSTKTAANSTTNSNQATNTNSTKTAANSTKTAANSTKTAANNLDAEVADAIQKCKADKDCKSPVCYTKNAEVAVKINSSKDGVRSYFQKTDDDSDAEYKDLDDALCAVKNGILGYFLIISDSSNSQTTRHTNRQAWMHTSDKFLIHQSAVRNNQYDILKVLNNIGVKSSICSSMVHEAVYYDSSEILKRSIADGMDINQRDDCNLKIDDCDLKRKCRVTGITPIQIAAIMGHSKMIEELIAAGADININSRINLNGKRNYDLTPIQLAAMNNHVNAVKILIAAGADVDNKTYKPHLGDYDSKNYSSVYLAAVKGHTDLANELRLYVNPDITDETPVDKQVSNYYNQVNACVQNYIPKREDVESVVLEKMLKNSNQDADRIKKTQDYNESVQNQYAEVMEGFYDHKAELTDSCAHIYIEYYKESVQLPIIYDYCNGAGVAYKALIDSASATPESIMNAWDGKSCLGSFRIYKEDYVSSKNYFMQRLQKDMNDHAAEAAKIRKQNAQQRAEANRRLIYYYSPRGKCETRCNNEYTKNSDMWNTCMSICKDMRSE